MSQRDSLALVFCTLGDWPTAFEARLIESARPAGQDETALDGISLFKLPPASGGLKAAAQILGIRHPSGPRQLCVNGPVELHDTPLTSLYPLPPLLAVRCQLNGLRALILPAPGREKNCALVFDVGVVVEADSTL